LENVARVGEDPRVGDLVRKYNAKWIFFDERDYLLTQHSLKLAALRLNRNLTEVFHRGAVHIFSINLS
jgi:hypothetical protein